jgi:Mlc titration factor MtfA (ptsG expression regulator)
MVRWSQRFLAKKNWEGCDGFVVTDEVKRTVAFCASMLVLAYPHWYFDHTQTILMYSKPYVARAIGLDTQSGLAGEFHRAGETRHRGPIILNWRDVAAGAHSRNGGHHLVIHEFSHQLDMANDPSADGLPPLPNGIDSAQWYADLRGEFDAARQMVEQGYSILMDDYGLTHLSEFFAVGSELYFQSPMELSEYHPEVYRLLQQFYVTDTREWSLT